MDTKARKTPEQDTLSGARFSPPDPKAGAPAPPASGKKRIRKTGINFKGLRKNFLYGFRAVDFRWLLMRLGFSLANPASPGSNLVADADRRATFSQCTMTALRSQSGNDESDPPRAPSLRLGFQT
jgi:hypothetical protein